MTMAQSRDCLGGELLEPKKWVHRFNATEGILRVQIYEDQGDGYSEEHSRFLPDAYLDEEQVEFTLSVSGNVRQLRIDPALCPCVCKLQELTFNGAAVSLQDKKVFVTNGKLMKS